MVSTINRNKSSNNHLSGRVIRSGVWVFALRITERLLYFFRLIILARILAPSDFGLFGIALLTMMTLENFSQTGFESALIQKKEAVNQYLDTAWTVGVIRSIFLFLAMFFFGPYVAAFFETTQATPIIRVLAFSFLIKSFRNIGVVFFNKDLEFKKQFSYQLSGTLTDFIITVTAALILRSVWALVFGLLSGNVARLVASYTTHPYRPHFDLELIKAKELFGFGKWILGSNVVVFILIQGDDAVVGKILGVATLGLYQMAYKFANIPNAEITSIFSHIAFPAYSKIQNDFPRLRKSFSKVLKLTSFVSFPAGIFIFILAADFIELFLGKQWLPMAPVMKILSVYGVIGSIAGSFGPVFRGAGEPHIPTVGSLIQLILLIFIIIPLVGKFGMVGAAMSVLVSAGFLVIYLGKTSIRVLNFNIKDIILPIVSPAFCSTVMFFFVSFVSRAIDTTHIRFILILITGITVYLVSILLIDRDFKDNLWKYGRAIIKHEK